MKKLTFSVVQGNYFRQLLWKTKFLWLIKPCAVSVAGYILSFTVSFPLSMLELPLRLWRVSFSCQLHWHESSTTEQKGSSLNIREVIFNYFIVIKSFPRYSIITVAHTSIVWHLLRQTRQVIMSFFMYSSMEHISVTEFEETLLVLYSLKQDFILTSISTDA